MKEKSNKENKKGGFYSKLAKYMDLTVKARSGFRIEIISDKNGYKSFLLYGVKRIEKYLSDCIILDTEKEVLVFSGNSLECITYASDTIEICGKVLSLNFEAKGNKKNV